MWDTRSWGTYSAGSGGFGSSERGKTDCNNQGKNILNAVKRVRQDQRILWNPVKDESFYNSKYYHQFQHWKDFSCDLVQLADGSKVRSLRGYTGEGFAERSPVVVTKPVDPADLGIRQKPRGNVLR